MDRELLFAQKLEEIKSIAREQGNCISEEQVRESFAEWNLGEDQFGLVKEYLQNNKIGIGEPVNLDDYLTDDEISYLDNYLTELKQIETVSEGEREAITLSAMAGDTQAQQRFMNLLLTEVIEIAKLYSGQGVLLEDLIGEGNVAIAAGVTMLGCLENAKEAQGMIAKMIMDAMEDYISGDVEESKTDKKIVERVNKVAEAAKELAEDLHRKVSVEELSQESGLTQKVILEALRISGNKIEDIDVMEDSINSGIEAKDE